MRSWPMRGPQSNVTFVPERVLVPVGSGDVRATVVRHDFICCVLGDYVVMQMFLYLSPQHC